MVITEATKKNKSVKQRSALLLYNLNGLHVTKPIQRVTMSVAIEPLCFWEVAKLKTCHNQPPVIATPWYSQRNKLYQLIHPKISLHRSLQWYIFKMKIYLYNLWIFHSSLYCTVPFCPSKLCLHNCHLEGVHRVTWERQSVCGLCFTWKKSVAGILFFISNYQCGEHFACLSSLLANHFGGWLIWKAWVFFSLFFPHENTACRNCKKHLLWHRFTL